MSEAAVLESQVVEDNTEVKPVEKAVEPVKTETKADPAKDAPVVEDKTEEAKSAFGDNWREEVAAGDEELAKLAKRYSSPKGILKALREAQVKISSGVKLAKPDETDAEAMAEWRKAEGIPEAATGYVIPEPIQKRLVDEDKPILASYTEAAHKAGMRGADVASTIAWYVELQETAAAKQADNDKAATEAAEDALRKDWSHSEYKGNVSLAHNWVKEIPGLGTDLALVRAPDGVRLVDNPKFISWAADQARMSGMDTSFVNGDAAQKSATRKAEIEKMMNTDINRYHQEGMDKEYAAILDKETKRR